MPRRALLIAVAFILSSLGCRAEDHVVKYADPSIFDVKPALKRGYLVPVWDTYAAPIVPFTHLPQEYAGVEYIKARDAVITAASTGVVTKRLASNGELLWSKRFEGKTFQTTPTAYKGRIFLPTLEGDLLAINETDGELLWEAKAENSMEGRVAVGRDLVIGLDTEDVLYAWNLETGTLEWEFRNERTKNFTVRGASTPIFVGSNVVVGFAGGEIIAFKTTDGSEVWRLDISNGATEFADVDLMVEARDKTLIAVGRASGLYKIDPKDGSVIWRVDMPSISAIEVTPKVIYAATANNKVVAFDKKGNRLWQFRFKDASPTTLKSYGDYLVVATGGGGLYLLDGISGYPFERFFGESGYHAPMTFGGKRLYLQADSGALFTYKVGR